MCLELDEEFKRGWTLSCPLISADGLPRWGLDCLKFVEKKKKKRKRKQTLLFLAFKLFSSERRSVARTVPLTLCRCAKYAWIKVKGEKNVLSKALPLKECRLYLISSVAIRLYTTTCLQRSQSCVNHFSNTFFSPLFGKSNFFESELSVKVFNDASFWKISTLHFQWCWHCREWNNLIFHFKSAFQFLI